jgi:serine/threonine protein kinase
MLAPQKSSAIISSLNIQDSLRPQITQEIIKVEAKKLIGNSKFPVYLAVDPANHKQYAMKMFHYKVDKINESYKNESRFATLSHPNLVPIIQVIDHKRTSFRNEIKHSSYILMELARADLASILETTKVFSEEKMIRTYFLQAANAVEFLHAKGIHHLDIKLENFLMGYDYNLKISDFDTAYFISDPYVRSAGTINYRAPELDGKPDCVPVMADAYSLGICLFVLKVGYLPYKENHTQKGNNLMNLLFEDPDEFWRTHEKINPVMRQADEDFRDLFVKLTRKNPAERMSIDQIKHQKWTRQGVYKPEELESIMKKNFEF